MCSVSPGNTLSLSRLFLKRERDSPKACKAPERTQKQRELIFFYDPKVHGTGVPADPSHILVAGTGWIAKRHGRRRSSSVLSV